MEETEVSYKYIWEYKMEQLLSKTAEQYLLKWKHTCALKPINSIPQSKGIKHTSNKVHSKKKLET